jgi:hypothetical protein
VTKRDEIVSAIGAALVAANTANGFSVAFGGVEYWDTLSEYATNTLIYSDTEEEYQEINQADQAILSLEIRAIVVGENSPNLINLVSRELRQLIRVNRNWGGLALNSQPISSSKICETGGKKTTELTLTVRIIYREAV